MSGERMFPKVYHDAYKNDGRERVVVDVGKVSMARQEFRDECDINTIMERYQTTGQLPANRPGPPMYVDFTEVPMDLMSTMSMFDKAEAAFMTLPAKVRREFDNNAHEFVAFASNRENLGTLREWGLAPPAEVPDAPRTTAPASEGPPPTPIPDAP